MKTSYLFKLSLLTFSLFFVKLFYTGSSLAAQDKKHTYTLGANVFKGPIMKHRQDFGHLSYSYPTGMEIFLNKNTYGHKLWEQLYNYPDIGFSLGYYHYHNPLLGISVSANTYYDFYLLRRKRSEFIFRLATGLVYTSNPYDEEENPENRAISTPISFTLQGRLGYHYALTDQTSLISGLTLTHFSNGAIRKPNSGINIITANLGIAHRLQAEKPAYQYRPDPAPVQEGISLNIQASSGLQAIDIRPDASFPFLNLSLYADYRLSHVSAVSIGLDGFYSTGVRERMRHELEGEELPDFKRAGITAGHELFIHKTSILVQLGAYIYAPYPPERPIYQRYGLKYYIHEHIYGMASFRAHYGRAENLEFSLGIRI